MLDHGSFRISGPVQAKASLTKEVTIYRVEVEDMAVTGQP